MKSSLPSNAELVVCNQLVVVNSLRGLHSEQDLSHPDQSLMFHREALLVDKKSSGDQVNIAKLSLPGEIKVGRYDVHYHDHSSVESQPKEGLFISQSKDAMLMFKDGQFHCFSNPIDLHPNLRPGNVVLMQNNQLIDFDSTSPQERAFHVGSLQPNDQDPNPGISTPGDNQKHYRRYQDATLIVNNRPDTLLQLDLGYKQATIHQPGQRSIRMLVSSKLKGNYSINTASPSQLSGEAMGKVGETLAVLANGKIHLYHHQKNLKFVKAGQSINIENGQCLPGKSPYMYDNMVSNSIVAPRKALDRRPSKAGGFKAASMTFHSHNKLVSNETTEKLGRAAKTRIKL